MDGIVYQIYESVNLHLRQSIHSPHLLLILPKMILLHVPVSHFTREVHLWTFCINNLCLIDVICRQHILLINTQTQQRVNKCCTHNRWGYTKFQTVAFFHVFKTWKKATVWNLFCEIIVDNNIIHYDFTEKITDSILTSFFCLFTAIIKMSPTFLFVLLACRRPT